MEKVKITKEMLTDYIGRPSVEEMTVKDLLMLLRFQPDGAGSTRSYNASLKKLEMLNLKKNNPRKHLIILKKLKNQKKNKNNTSISIPY